MRKGKPVQGHVNYIDRKITLLSITELSPGTHRFEGNFTLPYDIPSSIECLNGEWKKASGCIRYKVEVHINRLGQVEDKFETPFNVVNSVDLNEISPTMLAPLMHEVHRVGNSGILLEFFSNFLISSAIQLRLVTQLLHDSLDFAESLHAR
jgi:hypothetical protein